MSDIDCEILERVARAICRATITHEVVGEGFTDEALNQAVENLTVKFYPEARAAILAMPLPSLPGEDQ